MSERKPPVAAEALEALSDAERRAMFAAVLGIGPAASEDPRLQAFAQHLEDMNATALAFRIPRESPEGVALLLLLPGQSAVVMPGDPDSAQVDAVQTLSAVEAATCEARRRGAAFAQTLITPPHPELARVLERAGYRYLTDLLYLQRRATHPWVDAPDEALRWRPYAADRHEAFVQVLGDTYAGSADCPELSALRSPEAALAAHGATRHFDADLWELAYQDNQPAGILLLSKLPGAASIEVTYMGVAQRSRGRGIGGQLLRRTLQQARRLRLERVLLAVDERNSFARRLYESFGFALHARRAAYLAS